MAGKYLGDEFDIHGGGLDLRFPHHENELAQSTAAGQRFARYWMHNAWVTAAGEKMSKSLGNGALVSEVVKRYPARAVRLYLAAAALPLGDRVLRRLAGRVDRPRWPGSTASSTVRPTPSARPRARCRTQFVAAMNDDLGTPGAVAVLYEAVREGNLALDAGDHDAAARPLGAVAGMLVILGLDAGSAAWRPAAMSSSPRWSTAWSRSCSSSAPTRGPARTSPPPTRSATPWPRPDRGLRHPARPPLVRASR